MKELVGHAAFLCFGDQLGRGFGDTHQPRRLALDHLAEVAPHMGMNQADDGDGVFGPGSGERNEERNQAERSSHENGTDLLETAYAARPPCIRPRLAACVND